MMNKKLFFIIGAPRSGTTLLLSYLSGIPNSKILYETKIFKRLKPSNYEGILEEIANYFDLFEEEIVIEKTPEHCFHLEDIERLRKLCKRDIYIIYILRPPVPTILSLISCSKTNPEVWGEIDLLGACEKYEESLISIYNQLILKSNKHNKCLVEAPVYGKNVLNETVKVDSYSNTTDILYSLCVTYRELIEDPFKTIRILLNKLRIEANVKSLIDNRITNTQKFLHIISKEPHHKNVLRDIEEVELERRSNISKQIEKGFSGRYIERSNYIRNYFEHLITKETIYDLVVNEKVLSVIKNPLVTIIVPLYNKENYIVETLNSIFNQTYQNLRVVIIDDASTDKSLEIVEEYYNSLPYHLQEKLWITRNRSNKGVSHTRNLGLNSLIKGEIYSFCDADDIWDITLVEKSVKTYEKYPYVDCVYSRVLNNGKEDKSKICNGNVFKDAIQYNFLGCGSNLFIKASIIKEYNLRFNELYNGVEDWDFLIQLSKIAVFKCTKEYLVNYRKVEDSLSSNTENQFNQGRKILNNYIEDNKQYSRLVTRLFFFYLSFKNFTWSIIKELDFRFILEIILDKCKSYVKSYLP